MYSDASITFSILICYTKKTGALKNGLRAFYLQNRLKKASTPVVIQILKKKTPYVLNIWLNFDLKTDKQFWFPV